MAERAKAWPRLLPLLLLAFLVASPAFAVGNGSPGDQAADVVEKDDNNADSGGCTGDPDDYDLTAGGVLGTQGNGATVKTSRERMGRLVVWFMTVTRFPFGYFGR
jgi:hypothetical protein